jgi:transcriptional regulator with XRE-family HTH domain
MKKQNDEFIRRFERLRLFKGWTIEEAARELGISRTMVHWIKKGRYDVTQKNWAKLGKIEAQAGFTEGTGSIQASEAKPGDIKLAVSSAAESARLYIKAEDLDRGVVEFPLLYRRGEPPLGFPPRLKIRAPSAEAAAKIISAIRLDEDFSPLFRACLEEKYTLPSFLDTLSPFSYEALREACLTMALGRNWRRLVPMSPPTPTAGNRNPSD